MQGALGKPRRPWVRRGSHGDARASRHAQRHDRVSRGAGWRPRPRELKFSMWSSRPVTRLSLWGSADLSLGVTLLPKQRAPLTRASGRPCPREQRRSRRTLRALRAPEPPLLEGRGYFVDGELGVAPKSLDDFPARGHGHRTVNGCSSPPPRRARVWFSEVATDGQMISGAERRVRGLAGRGVSVADCRQPRLWRRSANRRVLHQPEDTG